jgi:hypothetical protein
MYLAKSTNHEAPRYAVFSTLPSLHSCTVTIKSNTSWDVRPRGFVSGIFCYRGSTNDELEKIQLLFQNLPTDTEKNHIAASG